MDFIGITADGHTLMLTEIKKGPRLKGALAISPTISMLIIPIVIHDVV